MQGCRQQVSPSASCWSASPQVSPRLAEGLEVPGSRGSRWGCSSCHDRSSLHTQEPTVSGCPAAGCSTLLRGLQQSSLRPGCKKAAKSSCCNQSNNGQLCAMSAPEGTLQACPVCHALETNGSPATFPCQTAGSAGEDKLTCRHPRTPPSTTGSWHCTP